jgi:hypothetical protein
MTQLWPQAPGSLFVAYDSQGYGRGILTRLHTECVQIYPILLGAYFYVFYVTIVGLLSLNVSA